MSIGASTNLLLASAPPANPAYKLSKLDRSLGVFSYSFPSAYQGLGTNQAQSFSSDGLYMYNPQAGSKFVGQAVSATPYYYPFSSIQYNRVQLSNFLGCFLKPDGTKIWTIGGTGASSLAQRTCATAFDLSTAGTAVTANVDSAGSGGRSGVFFKDDGTKLYISSTTSETVEQYSLTTPWDISGGISYDSKQLSLGTEITAGSFRSIWIKSDGTTLWAVAESAPSSGNATVYEYTLGTAWDVSTGTYAGKSKVITGRSGTAVGFKDDGTYMYVIMTANSGLYYQGLTSTPLGTAWDITTAGATTTIPFGIGDSFTYSSGNIVPGGNYILTGTTGGSNRCTLLEYPVAWDYTALKAGPGIIHDAGGIPLAVRMRNSGTKAYLIADDKKVYEYTLSAANNLNSATYTGNSLLITTTSYGQIFDVSQTGTKLIVVQSTGSIKQYTMATAWDLSTASYDGDYTMSGLPSSNDCRLTYSTDGVKVFVDCAGSFYAYTLGTAWDVSTAGASTVSTSPYYLPQTLEITNSGTSLFIGSAQYTGVYTLSSANDVTSGAYVGKLIEAPSSLGSLGWYPSPSFSADGTAMYTYYQGNLRKFTLSTPWDLTTASLTATKTGLISGANFTAVTNQEHVLVSTGYNNLLYHYKMTTVGDVSTTTLVGSYTYTSCQSATFSSDGNYAYIVVNNFNVYSYPLGTAFDLSTAGASTLIGGSGSLTFAISLAGPDDEYMLLGSYGESNVRQFTKTGPGAYGSPTSTYRMIQPNLFGYNAVMGGVVWLGGNGLKLGWMAATAYSTVTRWQFVQYDINV